MADWFLNLPVAWMALIAFAATSLIAGGVYLVVTRLADSEWARVQAVSPGLLPVWAFFSRYWSASSRSKSGAHSIRQRLPLPPRPARCVL